MRPLRGHAEQALRAGTGQVDEALQRQPPGIDVVEHDRHQGLDAGHAGRRVPDRALPSRRACAAHGRSRARRRRRAVRPCQMPSRWRAWRTGGFIWTACRAVHSRRPTASDGAAWPRSSRHPCGGRAKRSPLPSRCGAHGCGRPARRAMPTRRSVRGSAAASRRARPGCEAGIAGNTLAEPLAQAELVLGMEGSAAARVGQDRGHACVVLDQKVAGRGTHEDLDAGRARQPLQLAELGDVVAGAADPEGEIAMHAAGARATACRPRRLALVVSGPVLGISKTAGHAAEHGRARAALQILLVARGRARGNGPGCRPRPAGREGRGSRSRSPAAAVASDAERGDAAADDADIAQARRRPG